MHIVHVFYMYKSYIPQMGNESRCRSFACKLSLVHEKLVYTDPRDQDTPSPMN